MTGPTSTPNDGQPTRELALAGAGSQDQVTPPGAAATELDCNCDDCDCPICVPGCC